MEKVIVFALYHKVANIVEDSFVENPDLYDDDEYTGFVEGIFNMIMKIKSNYDLVELFNHVYEIRSKYFRHSVGYDIFNSIFDVINETIFNLEN